MAQTVLVDVVYKDDGVRLQVVEHPSDTPRYMKLLEGITLEELERLQLAIEDALPDASLGKELELGGGNGETVRAVEVR